MKPARAAALFIAVCGLFAACLPAASAREAREEQEMRQAKPSGQRLSPSEARLAKAARLEKKQAAQEKKKAARAEKAASIAKAAGATAASLALSAPAAAATGKISQKNSLARVAKVPDRLQNHAEARLIAVYQLIGQGRSRDALRHAETLVQDHPNFQLAQLVYGDLLASRSSKKSGQPPQALQTTGVPGDMPGNMSGIAPDGAGQAVAAGALADLRYESQQRLRALREPPPAGRVPSQFVALSAQNRHAIAVDASRSRLYLFENAPNGGGLRLVADFYVSVGKLGLEKTVEGDLRTPLGVYYITSNLDPKSLKDLYGAGALPINYPNPLDVRRGKTGSGIWLHGVPAAQFARAPLATDGCIALANPDLQRLLSMVAIRTTPVVIAKTLQWVAPDALKGEASAFEQALQNWHSAKSSGDMARLALWYAPDFSNRSKNREQWLAALQAELEQKKEKALAKPVVLAALPTAPAAAPLLRFQAEIKDVSFLRWSDVGDTMVATFGEVAPGRTSGRTVRQYWSREPGSGWKIFFEAVI